MIDLVTDRRAAAIGLKRHRQLAGAGDEEIGGAILVAEGMAADDHRLGPARYIARDVLADDRLTEDGAAQDVADRPVGRLPHLLQFEFFDARLVRRDRRAFDANAVLQDRIGGIDRHLIVSTVTLFHAQVVIMQVDVEIGQDQLVPDRLPDHARHFVAVQLDNGFQHFDLRHRYLPSAMRMGPRI